MDYATIRYTVDDRVAVRDALFAVSRPPGKAYAPAQYVDALQALQQGLNVNYNGASGNVDLDEYGNVKSGYAIWETVRGSDKKMTYKTIGRFELVDLEAQLK